MTIQELVTRSYGTAVAKGWHDNDQDNVPTKLALIHSEVSEALEEYRNDPSLPNYIDEKGKPEGFGIELADVLIRVADLCGQANIDLESAVYAKLAYNETRPYRHGGKAI